MSDLIQIQSVRHSDGIPEDFFEKINKKKKKKKKSRQQKSMKNYSACKELICFFFFIQEIELFFSLQKCMLLILVRSASLKLF